MIKQLRIRNYRALADCSLDLPNLTVLFGPNGSGKSSLLDAVWFLRDAAIRDVPDASGRRSHGIGMRWDGAADGEPIAIELVTEDVDYTVSLSLSAGRIEDRPGERLVDLASDETLLERPSGSDQIRFLNVSHQDRATVELRQPETLSLGRYLDHSPEADGAVRLDRLLRNTHLHDSRSFDLYRLRQVGSEASNHYYLSGRGDNLWSVLQNLLSRSAINANYDRIIHHMRRAFPGFRNLVLETTGRNSVYSSLLFEGHEPILASGVADGHLQLLLVLTALFGGSREPLVMLDEPDLSLHPWAIAVLADAVREATEEWGRQIIVATHSPVLVSQFDVESLFVMELADGGSRATPVAQIEDLSDLLDQFAVGSLYMADLLGQQGPDPAQVETGE